ncbi:MAG TPA: hypothetical protein VN924_27505 [Bryobacteraceae bacterium]|nr:hypothetical protein [Bryobacteraceae bacterium]
MSTAIKLSGEAHNALVAGFEARQDFAVIREALLEKGADVSVRSISRWGSQWRAEQRVLEMAREQGLAIAGCHGKIFALESLARRIVLSPDWRGEREALALAAFRAFVHRPAPATLVAAHQQSLLLLFEDQLWAYHQVTTKPKTKVPRGTRGGR